MRRSVLLLPVLACSCGAVGEPPKAPAATSAPRPSVQNDTPRASLPGGSSDGVTCEQIRAEYVEEVKIGGDKGPADLTVGDFGNILNQGSYLDACEVPATSHLEICAAVRGGTAVGVTVAFDPPNPDLEVCVAKQVRALAFPSHPKTDFVTVRF